MRPRHGLTILEVLVALILMAIVLPGLTSMVTSSRKAQNSNIRMDQAYAYGQLVLDSLSIVPSMLLPSASTTLCSTSIAGTTYRAGTQVVDSAQGKVRVTVAWTQAGVAHSVSLQEILSRTGAYR